MELNNKLQILGSLSRRSRLCLRRQKTKWGKEYKYNPRQNLIRRIAREQNCSESEAEQLLQELRRFVMVYPQYF